MEEHSTNTEKVTVVDSAPKETKTHHAEPHTTSSHTHKTHSDKTHSDKTHSAPANKELTKAFWQYLSAGLAIVLVIVLFAQYDLSIDINKTGSCDLAAEDVGEIINDDSEDSAVVGAAVAVAYDSSDYYDEDDPMIGDPDALVTIVEFSDFQCPYCARFYSQTYLALKEDYIDTGKANLVFRDFPLSFHPEAEPSAIAAECANEQGEFWAFHDLIFENQDYLSSSAYLSWAEDLGLDMDQFEDCVNSQKYKSEVAKDYSDGGRLGITGTPGFFINGQLVTGAQPYSVFASAIDALLAE
tara:strand:- start:5891 stop:6784 length:894 start_codon:yes stop_codon:yes gene_type:complete